MYTAAVYLDPESRHMAAVYVDTPFTESMSTFDDIGSDTGRFVKIGVILISSFGSQFVLVGGIAI